MRLTAGYRVMCVATGLCAAATAAAFHGPATLAIELSPFALQRVGRSAPTQVISPVVVASWITERAERDDEQLQLLVLWRGAPGWFQRPGGVSGSWSGSRHRSTLTYGDVLLTLDYDSSAHVAIVNGGSVELGEDNVVFVDDVDSPTGPRIAGTMRLERTMPGSAGQIGLVLGKSPEVMAFLRCDATTADGRGRLERLCLENIGVER